MSQFHRSGPERPASHRATEAGTAAQAASPATRRQEVAMFLLLAVVIWPILSIAVVGGYGFCVWMYQLIAGPPGPPPV
ncbi:periplasmic nitrate reductase, NapE protein (plasmid) [Azospirillum thermophilum]|uniref:Periplasmic nitrate reductase, NapE protein n=2 Tax=Azospirillum thermophilum TaxID=2202148 RepID=A0A2S2CZK2_9PROT|nr:periplasmic nitrate reductase, NapE protein [Azospirillum thermophilum]